MESQPEASGNRYVLCSDDVELARLDRQAALIGPPTQLLLKAAGIGPGLRVPPRTGLGHVARLVVNWSAPPEGGRPRSRGPASRSRAGGRGSGRHHVSFR